MYGWSNRWRDPKEPLFVLLLCETYSHTYYPFTSFIIALQSQTLRLYNQCSFNKCYIFDKIIFSSLRIDKLNKHLNTVIVGWIIKEETWANAGRSCWLIVKINFNVYASFNKTYSLTIHTKILHKIVSKIATCFPTS